MFQIVQILSSYSTDIDRYSIYDMPISFSESLDASLLQDAYIILHMGVPQNGLHPKKCYLIEKIGSAMALGVSYSQTTHIILVFA